MNNNLDYSNEDVMKILNNSEYTDQQKKEMFESYKKDLKAKRKKQIVSIVNDLAQKNPIITQEIYVDFLKKYDDDNLSKPFNTIEKEIKVFESEMAQKYNSYIESKKQEEAKEDIEPAIQEEVPSQEEETPIVPDNKIETTEIPDITEAQINDESNSPLGESVLNEEPEILAKPLFESAEEAKDVMPNTLPSTNGEKGNASAIILSIIAIIVGIVVMYSILKIN